MNHRFLVVCIVLILISVQVVVVSADDSIPPVTMIQFNPSKPTGKQGWYNCTVYVTFIASDDDSGVNSTFYRLNYGSWLIYNDVFSLIDEGKYFIDFYSVDFAGNEESIKSAFIKIDKTTPNVDLYWEHGNYNSDYIFTARCIDGLSGMDRVEFYYNNELVHIDFDAPFEWSMTESYKLCSVKGLIFLRSIGTTIPLFAFFVKINRQQLIKYIIMAKGLDNSGNYDSDNLGNGESNDGIQSFDIPCNRYNFFIPLYLPNNFTGYLGKFWIDVLFRLEG